MNLYTSYVGSNTIHCRFRIYGRIRRFHRQRPHRQKTAWPRRVQNRLWFGGFQALFPLLGYFAASTFSKYVTAVDHWIIFGLLVLIGGNMVREAFEEDEENAKETADFDWKHMLPLAVACSIDAFAVGVSFAFMTLNIWISVIIIGITTGLFSAAGLYIGPRIRLALAETSTDRGWRRTHSDRRESTAGISRIPRITIASQIKTDILQQKPVITHDYGLLHYELL